MMKAEVIPMKNYQYAIIGFGKGGKTLAAKLASEQERVVLFEKDEKMYGGTCINVACIPTKVLVERSKRSFALGGDYHAKNERFKKAMERKDTLTSSLREKNYHKLADSPYIDVVNASASFLSSNLIKAGDEEYEAKTIIVDTGSRPFIPPIKGIDGERVLTSESLLKLTELPKKLLIVGGGYIGLEFASIFLNFGSEVTMLQNEADFLSREDKDLADAIEKDFIARGLKLYKSAKTIEFVSTEDKVTTKAEIDSMETLLDSDYVLVATGRRPNLAGLDIEKSGVELTSRGAIKVDEHNHTNVESIYAVGDVIGELQFTYVSLDDARIVYSSLKGDGSKTRLSRGYIPYSVFIDPPFSRVGLSEADARKEHDVIVKKILLSSVPKAHILENPRGLLKAIIDKKTGEILGAHLYSEESHEIINLIKLAMDHKIPYTDIRDMIFTHPSISEALNDLFA
jgi:pyruvate/2-oxoglutarate dehydrogenase complex dihydrolipoamide dehydrogenase (E3) component